MSTTTATTTATMTAHSVKPRPRPETNYQLRGLWDILAGQRWLRFDYNATDLLRGRRDKDKSEIRQRFSHETVEFIDLPKGLLVRLKGQPERVSVKEVYI